MTQDTQTVEERRKTTYLRREGSGRCECGKYYVCLAKHLSSVREYVIGLSTKEKLLYDEKHPKETAKIHETYFK